MEEKVMFVEPEAEVVRFPKQDIVTTSGVSQSTTMDGIELPDIPLD